MRVVPAQDGPRMRETAAFVRARERAWRRAAAAWLCAAEEVHGTLGRAWVGSGALVSEEAPADNAHEDETLEVQTAPTNRHLESNVTSGLAAWENGDRE